MEVRRRTTVRSCWQWQVMAVRAEAGGVQVRGRGRGGHGEGHCHEQHEMRAMPKRHRSGNAELGKMSSQTS